MRPVAMLLLVGCSDFNLEKVQESLDGGVRVIAADPDLVEFGVQATNAPITETVSVVATGSLAVTIDGMEVAGASAYTITWAGEEVVLEPGTSTDVVVTYTPASHDDQASLTITSDATDPRLVVPLAGAGTFPAIELSPPSLSLETDALLPVDDEVIVTSVGTADLVVSAMVVDGVQFTATAELPMSLAPGESAPISVRYAPEAEGEEVTGKLWLTTNTAEGFAVVPLQGRDGPACVGLGEAWDRGLIEAYLTEGGSLSVVERFGETDVCIDHWYVWLSEDSQDLGAGDMTGDFGGTYPEGLLGISAGRSLRFGAGDRSGAAWWCMEQTQYTRGLSDYTFTGGRVPEPLRSFMLDHDQEDVWAWMDENAVMIAGRDTNYVEVGRGGGAAEIGLRVTNMGGEGGLVEIRETVPAGWAAGGFSQAPVRVDAGADGASVYVFEASLAPREETGPYEHTLYDEAVVTYTLTVPPCEGRQALPPMETRWTDAEGAARVGTANPLVVRCL